MSMSSSAVKALMTVLSKLRWVDHGLKDTVFSRGTISNSVRSGVSRMFQIDGEQPRRTNSVRKQQRQRQRGKHWDSEKTTTSTSFHLVVYAVTRRR